MGCLEREARFEQSKEKQNLSKWSKQGMKRSKQFLSGRNAVVCIWVGERQYGEVEESRKFLAGVFIGYGLSLFDHLIFGGPKSLPSIKQG